MPAVGTVTRIIELHLAPQTAGARRAQLVPNPVLTAKVASKNGSSRGVDY
jgi:hypothetical protein